MIMRHDRDLQPITLIRPRKLPAIALSVVLVLPLFGLLALRRDALVWMGEPLWIVLSTLSAVALALAAIRLVNAAPLMRVSPSGIEIPKILSTPIRWLDIAKIQAGARRGATGDIHDRLLFHFKHPQIMSWQSPKLRRILGDTPQAAIAVDIGMIWPLRADDLRKIIHDAALTYAKAPAVQSDMAETRHGRRKIKSIAILLLCAVLPGIMHFSDIGLPRQFSQGLAYYNAGDVIAAIPYLEDDARAGDTEAATALATLYLNGDGLTRNPAMAAGWFRRAAEAGHAEAAYNLGNAYRLGLGAPQDLDQALLWYERAAEGGSSLAAFTLGNIYRLGDGVIRDYKQAVAWLMVAADKGYAPAEHDLGRLYHEGVAVSRDTAAAQDWYSRAAARGHAPARYDLARLLLNGDSKQRHVGLVYLQQAAENGYAPAQRRLAAVLYNGQDIPRDPIEAFKWISLAERSWPAPSRADLVREKSRIAKALVPDQLAEAKSRIRAWRPAKTQL